MNLCPDEAALLLFFCWETVNPYLHTERHQTKSVEHYQKSWAVLFGADATREDAIRILKNEFAITNESAAQMNRAGEVIQCAKHYGLAGKNLALGRLFICEDTGLESRYEQIYGSLYIHEAIILTFLSWQTFCPTLEELLPSSFDSGGRQRLPALAFSKRLKAWKDLFEGLDRWQVVERIASDFASEEAHHDAHSSIARAVKLCRELESLSCVQNG